MSQVSDAAKMKKNPTGDTINREGMRLLGQLASDPKTEQKIQIQAAKLAKVAKVKCDAKVDEIYRYHIPHLSEYIPNLPKLENCFVRTRMLGSVNQSAPTKEHIFHPAVRPQQIEDEELVLADVIRSKGNGQSLAFTRAGIRKYVRWNRAEVKAAIITCGGLCPGLNDVIEELVKVLYYDYGVDDVYGIRDGYRGLYEPEYASKSWKGLKPADVDDIHRKGGTVLGSARGGFDMNKMMDALTGHCVNQVYIVGGDGSHRAAYDLYEECVRRKLKISIVAIPKTIDNDIGIIDSSFGFNTAIEEAQKSIVSARVEAGCTVNGIGIVKLMGRESGMIAAHATIASREVDICLIPEVPFEMNGPHGLLAYLEKLLKTQGHAVIVVSEGAGEDIVQSAGTTTTGHKILPEIGPYLKKQIQEHFTKLKWEFSIKYHDPSYMIRSVPSNAADSVYCMILAQNAVHGAMAGFTGFSSAVVNNRSVYLPLDLIAATSPVFLNPYGRTYQRVLSVTQQPYFLPANHVFHQNAPKVSKL